LALGGGARLPTLDHLDKRCRSRDQTNPRGSVFNVASQTTIPTCAIFSFDANQQITQLALYMDRYKLMKDLFAVSDPQGHAFEAALKKFLAGPRPRPVTAIVEQLRRLLDELEKL
jgi:hypothetical protein